MNNERHDNNQEQQSNNTMIHELSGLETIETNSRRGGGQPFDLEHDSEAHKFLVSDAFYAKEKMKDNGFTAHVGHGNVYLSVQSNEESVSYKGRKGYEKGKEFTSTTTSELLTKLGLTGELKLVEIGQKDNATYYRVEAWTTSSSNGSQEESDQISDEVVAQ